MWFNLESLRINSQYILLSLIIICSLISLGLLIFLYKKYLDRKVPEITTIYILLIITVVLHLTFSGISAFLTRNAMNMAITGFQETGFYQLAWSKVVGRITPILALVYSLWKLKSTGKPVANN